MNLTREEIETMRAIGFVDKQTKVPQPWVTTDQFIALCDAALQALDQKEQGEWESLSSIPKDGSEFLCTDGRDVFTVQFSNSNVSSDAPYLARSSHGELWNAGSYYEHENEYMFATHWMPLPTPPEDTQCL